MAYFCYTLLMSPTGEPSLVVRDAARRYRVTRHVLSTIRRLSSTKGGSVARKANAVGQELTRAEVRFLEEAVRTLISRAAEVAHDPNVDRDQIRLSDLPTLTG